jgi:hypothetical protein
VTRDASLPRRRQLALQVVGELRAHLRATSIHQPPEHRQPPSMRGRRESIRAQRASHTLMKATLALILAAVAVAARRRPGRRLAS